MVEERRKDYQTKEPYSYEEQPSYETPSKKIKAKKLDLIENLIGKIVNIVVDKIADAVPTFVRKVVGIGVDDYNPSDGYGYGGGGLQSLKGLGVFGYLPLVILKLVDGISYFIKVLKKNKFLRTFLVPALVMLTVLGSIVFLIWFMQPDDYGQNGYANYIETSDKNYDKNDMYRYNVNNFDSSRTAMRSFNKNIM